MVTFQLQTLVKNVLLSKTIGLRGTIQWYHLHVAPRHFDPTLRKAVIFVILIENNDNYFCST